MNRATTMDRVLGVVMTLFGLCGLATWPLIQIGKSAPNLTEEQLAQMNIMPDAYLAIASLLGLALIVGGIGTFLAARWGFLLAAIVTGLSVVLGGWGMVLQSQQSAGAYGLGSMVGSIISMLLYLSFCAYCLSRWMSRSSQP